jgi:hypothetical protein
MKVINLPQELSLQDSNGTTHSAWYSPKPTEDIQQKSAVPPVDPLQNAISDIGVMFMVHLYSWTTLPSWEVTTTTLRWLPSASIWGAQK